MAYFTFWAFIPDVARLRSFLVEEHGAVTVDWVVLTAAITGLGLASAAAVRTGTSDLGGDIETALTDASVVSLGCMGAGSGPAGWECYNGPTIQFPGAARAFGTSAGFVEQVDYIMSDGQVYQQTTTYSGGSSNTVWTNGAGDVVDAPPPQ